jgi:protein-arginine kinase activator protein McsA
MTTQEALAQVSTLMIQLIERVKDRTTASLVQQIQSLNQTIQAGYFTAEQKSLDRQQELFNANRKIAKMEDEHPKAIAALKKEYGRAIAKLNDEITTLKNPKSPPAKNWGSQPLIPGRMEFPGGPIRSP